MPGVPVALCSVERPILKVYPFSMTPARADFVSYCDTAANKFWVLLQHTIALVSNLLQSLLWQSCLCACVRVISRAFWWLIESAVEYLSSCVATL